MKHYIFNSQRIESVGFLLVITVFGLHVQGASQELAIKRGFWHGKEMEYVDRKIALKVKGGVGVTELTPLVGALHGKFLEPVDVIRWTTIEIPESLDLFTAIQTLQLDSSIELAIPVGVTRIQSQPNDPYFKGTTPATYPYQWGTEKHGSVTARRNTGRGHQG